MADDELKKAFSDLQQQMLETEQRVKASNNQIDGLKRGIQHTKLTDKEIEGLPEGTRTYESVGRSFILRPAGDIRGMLDERMKLNDQRIAKLTEQTQYMEKSVKESEQALRELVRQRQAKA